MRWLVLIGGLSALSLAAAPKQKPAKPAPKPETVKPKTAAKATPAKSTEENSSLAQTDKTCRRDQAWGKLDAVRARCADLSPAKSAIATYWRLTLTDDPNDLRKGFAPGALAKGEVDARLLLTAGRYPLRARPDPRNGGSGRSRSQGQAQGPRARHPETTRRRQVNRTAG